MLNQSLTAVMLRATFFPVKKVLQHPRCTSSCRRCSALAATPRGRQGNPSPAPRGFVSPLLECVRLSSSTGHQHVARVELVASEPETSTPASRRIAGSVWHLSRIPGYVLRPAIHGKRPETTLVDH